MVLSKSSENISSIELSDFSISFSDQKRIIDSLNIKFEAGKTYLLTGPTGSGKSTLLKFLKGIVPLFYPALITGEVLINDSSVSLEDLWSLRSNIAYVSQDPSLQVIGSTVKEDLAFGLENLALPPETINNRIVSLADTLNIQHLLTRSSAELSGGELALVNLASILILEPQVILLDEITAFLDVNSRNNVLDLVVSIKDSSKILVIVSHRVHDFLPLVDEVITLDRGSVQFHGSSKHFIRSNFSFITNRLRLDELFRVGVPFCDQMNIKEDFNTPEQLIDIIRGILSE
ncbi:MAG: energy-coupling factor ABC transporter ATP-binding protein [Candidatus Hodarchaeales archaeon]